MSGHVIKNIVAPIRALQVTYNSLYKANDTSYLLLGMNILGLFWSLVMLPTANTTQDVYPSFHVSSKNIQVSYGDNKMLMHRESSEALSKKNKKAQ